MGEVSEIVKKPLHHILSVETLPCMKKRKVMKYKKKNSSVKYLQGTMKLLYPDKNMKFILVCVFLLHNQRRSNDLLQDGNLHVMPLSKIQENNLDMQVNDRYVPGNILSFCLAAG